MGTAQKSSAALRRLTLAALWRRKGSSALLAAVAALGVFASIALYSLTARQEAAMAEMVRNTLIQCVVTDAQGMNSENLRMNSAFVDMLAGLRHEQGCRLDEEIKNLRAKASDSLVQPMDSQLRRILSFDSDSALSAVEGASIDLWEGWDEEVLHSGERVCLISSDLAAQTDSQGRSWLSVVWRDGVCLDLQVIGAISGGPEKTVWCPFYLQRQEGVSEIFLADSCSFDVADNARLDQCKDSLYETFVEPKRTNVLDLMTYGVLVQDETYRSTLEEFTANLSLLRLLLPVLTALCGGIGFLAGYLTIRSRIREFAVMRCLGLKRRRVFAQVFAEQSLLAALGAAAGGTAGFLLEGGLSGGALLRAGVSLAVFLAGAAAAAASVSRVNVMKLMKVEESA